MVQIPMKCKYPMSWIPNIDGYKVGVVTFRDNQYVESVATVKKGEDGLHRLDVPDYTKILGWFEVKQ